MKMHRQNLYEKLGVGNQAELLAVFIRELKGGVFASIGRWIGDLQ
ncbi:hypothetical protein ACFPU0_23140 [Pseudomonas sp. GCM10022186]